MIDFGLDADPAETARAARRGIYRTVLTASATAIPLPDASVATAISNSTLEHIPDLDPVLADVARVVRAGGTFVFTVPSDEFHACLRGHPVIELAARLRGVAYRERIDQRLAHHRYPTPDEWRALLARNGFSLVRVERYFPRAAVRAWEGLSSVTGGIAFELRGGGRPTRAIQHDLRMERRSPRLAGIAAWIAKRYAGRAFSAQVRPGEPSGGLLLVGRRGEA